MNALDILTVLRLPIYVGVIIALSLLIRKIWITPGDGAKTALLYVMAATIAWPVTLFTMSAITLCSEGTGRELVLIPLFVDVYCVIKVYQWINSLDGISI